MLITFEGGEGCGKSTQVELLKSYLAEKGRPVLATREPGGTELGQKLRELLLRQENKLDWQTEIYLFAADRCEHVSQVILPALAERKIVICDRFIDSTIAYQAGGRQLPEDLVRYVNMVAAKGLIPDLTFLLDVAPKSGLIRAGRKGAADRFEAEDLAFHTRVRESYLRLARDNPERIIMINTETAALEATQKKIRETVDAKL